jgi:hypothetical protein
MKPNIKVDTTVTGGCAVCLKLVRPDHENPVHIGTTCYFRGCVRWPDPVEMTMNRDAGFASPAQLHLGSKAWRAASQAPLKL